MTNPLLQKSMDHIWHPCAQMKDYETFKPLIISGATQSYLLTSDGRKVIDAISSWWCKLLGHQHPLLKQALLEQVEKFEHVLFANTINEPIVKLSEKLTGLTQTLKKVFYASEGSSAVEIALKMCVHAQQLKGEATRTKFIALQNSYHGETTGALSVSDLGLYRSPYKSMLFAADFISALPYVNSVEESLWQDCEKQWNVIEKKLEAHIGTTAAVIVEPIVQGAGGMLVYSKDFLARLRQWTKKHGIYLIADEIMTGLCRTGKTFACDHASIEPDLLCLAKNLTAGWLPFSAVLMTNEIYDLFYHDYAENKSFLHSHTFSGNAMAANVALRVLRIMEEENLCNKANKLGAIMHKKMLGIAQKTNKLKNVRGIGAMVAADLNCDPSKRLGYEVYQHAIKLGAFLRPLGNTIYWLPPLNTNEYVIDELAEITEAALLKVEF